jgi:predicted CXXCH cytochrome family protein
MAAATLAAAPTTQPALVTPVEMSEDMFDKPTTVTSAIPRGRMLHPQTMPSDWSANHSHGSLPLVRTAAINTSGQLPAATAIGCRTCHNPHADRGTRSLLRTPDASQPTKVCFECHKDQKSVDHSMHARTLLPPDKNNKLLCGPCHAVHAVEGSTKTKLWAAKQDTAAPTATEQRCLGCHDSQIARRPELPKHPQVIFGLVNFASHANSLENGRITCDTCHLPHGREDLPAPPPNQTKAMRSAGKPMLRANVDRDTCATCHGDDASRMFLYFHEPERRRNVAPARPPSELPY